MQKNTNLRLFSKLAKKAYKISKKKNLGWSWHDAQRWTSANLYKDFKGQYPSKVRVTDINTSFEEVISGKPRTPKVFPQRQRQKIQFKNCFNAFELTDEDVEDINYWFLEDVVFGKNGRFGFDDNLNVDVKIDGIIDTGIIKKKDLISLQYVVEYLRRQYKDKNTGNFPDIGFKRLYIDPKGNLDSPCNTYLLITEIGSMEYNRSPEDVIVITEKDLSPEEQEKRRIKQKEIDETLRLGKLKREAVGRKRPEKLEVEPEAKPEKPKKKEVKKQEISLSREDNIRIILKDLRQDWKDGLYTNKEYKALVKQITDKLEKGGQI
jgi:hypothetical protein